MESSLASLELLRTTQVSVAYDYAIKTLQDFREAKAAAGAKKPEAGKNNTRADGTGFAAESPGEKKDMNIPEKVRKPTTLVEQLRASLKIKLAEGKIIHIG